MQRWFSRAAVAVPAVAGASFVQPAWLVVSAASLAAATAFWWLSRCHHPRPLGLLPPTADAAGVEQPAQWFCGHCGKRWPAAFDHGKSPVQRFRGYDESKAKASAKRAEELADSQRKLAVRRAGMTARNAPADRMSRPLRPSAAVPIRPRQLVG